jgi:hypothetical protein
MYMDWIQPGTLESFGTGAALIAGMLILVRERRATQRYQESVMKDFKEMVTGIQEQHRKDMDSVMEANQAALERIIQAQQDTQHNHFSGELAAMRDVCTGLASVKDGLGDVRSALAAQSELVRDCASRRKGGDTPP